MADSQKLKPRGEKPAAKRRAATQKGTKVPEQRKALREYLERMLMLEPSEEFAELLEKMGLEEKEQHNASALVGMVLNKALGGDLSSFKEIRDLLGERGGTGDDELLQRAEEILNGVPDGI